MNTHRLIVYIIMMLMTLTARAGEITLYPLAQLSSGNVTRICQDSHGYVWVGTAHGLNKFDGYGFTSYHYLQDDTMSLTDNEIACMLTDTQGRLWVGSAKGLDLYDYHADNFRRYRMPDGNRPRVNSLAETASGDLLIGTAGYGMCILRKGSNSVEAMPAYNKRAVDNYFSRMAIGRKGEVWRSSHLNTITRFDADKLLNVKGQKDFQATYGQPMSFVDMGEEMLVVCVRGIMTYNYASGLLAPASYDMQLLDNNVSITQAVKNKRGDIYIATAGSGLMVIRHGSRTLERVPLTGLDIDYRTLHVACLMVDRDGNVWAGCPGKGVVCVSSREPLFRNTNFTQHGYRLGGTLTSVAMGEKGTLWCAVDNNGVYGISAEGDIVQHPQSPTGTRLIYRDTQGRYWLATENRLYSYNPHTGQYALCQTFDSGSIRCMTSDAEGRLYISQYGLGITVYNHATGSVSTLSMTRPLPAGRGHLCNDWVTCMRFDSQGLLWVGTANGLSVYDPGKVSFRPLGWEEQLSEQQCYALCETSGGNMMVSTSAGLYLYSRDKKTMSLCPGYESMQDKMVYAMERAPKGDVWLSTSRGVWQYDEKRAMFIARQGNMPRGEYVEGASLVTDSGYMYFGHSDGVTAFNVAEVSRASLALGKTYLTRLTAGGRSKDVLSETFSLESDENNVTMEFSLLNYANNSAIAFQYRINDGEWMQTQEGDNTVVLSQLQSGTYRIKVRAICNGTPSPHVLSLYLTVARPWYRSPYAMLFYIAVVCSFVVLVLYNYERQRRRDLEESKMQFLINATHDIRSPLTLIMGPVAKLRNKLSQTEFAADVETIEKNAQRLLLLVNQILDERKLDRGQMRLKCRKTNMVAFADHIFNLYRYNATQHSIDFTLQSEEPEMEAWVDRTHFDKVISNLLSNAFKYTPDGGSISVALRRHTQQSMPTPGGKRVCDFMELTVTDSGHGFSDDKTDKFFTRFYQGDTKGDEQALGTGIGLNLCRAITELHGGHISAANRKDGQTGAILTVLLPLGTEHLLPEQIADVAEEAEQQTAAHRGQASRNLRILTVDDNADIADYIAAELGDWYRFDYAPNGKEALAMMLKKHYDAVVSDVMMPEMDGISLLRAIKGNANISDVPVILLTSKAEVEYRLEGLKRGADAYIAKPFNMEELHITIDNLVDNVRRLRGKFNAEKVKEVHIENVEVKGNNDVLMEKISQVINEHLSDPDLNMDMLTREVGISRAQLHRKMKEIMGVSTTEFIRNLRLEQAARLIREGKINITQVAYSVGLNNQTHFSTIFKKHFGVSPSEYAARQGKDK